jgi:predicted acyltransferase
MGTKSPAASAPSSSTRLVSIDALRGFDMFWISGGDALFKGLAAAGAWSFADLVDTQLEHVAWEGFHFYDLIFPLFLFVVGAVLPFSLASHIQKGESKPRIYWRILRRTVLLFVLGLLVNNLLRFDFPNMRYAGVLQRIALCYGLAALIVMHVGWRGQAVISAVLLVGYWVLLASVAAPGFSAGDFTKEGNWPGWVDRTYLPGKINPAYFGYGDNEGIVSTIPAVVTALLGALAGHWLRSAQRPGRKVLGLLLAGVVCLGVGWVWGLVFPIIKILWTSSYVLFAAGWSLLLLAFFYGIIDVLGWRRWAFFFVVIGANAIVIYVAPKFFNFEYTGRALFGGLAHLSGAYGPVVIVAGVLAIKWLLLLYLFRKKLFLRV